VRGVDPEFDARTSRLGARLRFAAGVLGVVATLVGCGDGEATLPDDVEPRCASASAEVRPQPTITTTAGENTAVIVITGDCKP
jgi:hypothetical protein